MIVSIIFWTIIIGVMVAIYFDCASTSESKELLSKDPAINFLKNKIDKIRK